MTSSCHSSKLIGRYGPLRKYVIYSSHPHRQTLTTWFVARQLPIHAPTIPCSLPIHVWCLLDALPVHSQLKVRDPRLVYGPILTSYRLFPEKTKLKTAAITSRRLFKGAKAFSPSETLASSSLASHLSLPQPSWTFMHQYDIRHQHGRSPHHLFPSNATPELSKF